MMKSVSRIAILFLAILINCAATVQAADEAPLSESKDIPAVKKALKMAPAETAIFVGDMHCGNCAKKVARKLYAVKGVTKVRTDLKIDVAIVTPQQNQQLDAKALWAAAEKSGILPIKLIGPAGVIEADEEAKKEASKPHDHAAEQTKTS
ncbi:heavy-metal-associated domain-containing protein [Bythopirellula polymerisocia]|uniref:Heavy-metal-associated domain protein n=1 Tax=Bythopirellula polymerisocia TaxID=2528003 RepID=A0A5C6CYL5_9BACT|nr:heavy-metal-associated domain-containing protein [Bythopirellula polymerisocia]TWU28086.1 Heavy-metal-associated domain protein [Bythopirellula polymerisocia]